MTFNDYARRSLSADKAQVAPPTGAALWGNSYW